MLKKSPPISKHSRPCSYEPEVQQALIQVWEHANRICAKRLIPYLPTVVAALERHGHLQLTSESRNRLLAMSVSTVERCLRACRKPPPQKPGITQAGPLPKEQIPIRTFQQWDETQPGFV